MVGAPPSWELANSVSAVPLCSTLRKGSGDTGRFRISLRSRLSFQAPENPWSDWAPAIRTMRREVANKRILKDRSFHRQPVPPLQYTGSSPHRNVVVHAGVFYLPCRNILLLLAGQAISLRRTGHCHLRQLFFLRAVGPHLSCVDSGGVYLRLLHWPRTGSRATTWPPALAGYAQHRSKHRSHRIGEIHAILARDLCAFRFDACQNLALDTSARTFFLRVPIAHLHHRYLSARCETDFQLPGLSGFRELLPDYSSRTDHTHFHCGATVVQTRAAEY